MSSRDAPRCSKNDVGALFYIKVAAFNDTMAEWIQIPEIVSSVDAVYSGPALDGQTRAKLSQDIGASANLFLAESDFMESMDEYFGKHNQGRPFILISDRTGALNEYVYSHPGISDRLIAVYSLDSISSETVQASIASFIGTRTYCLRERVTVKLEED